MSKNKRLPIDRSTWPLLKRLLREAVRPYRGRILLAACCMVVGSACTAANAWLMEPVVNEIFVGRHTEMLAPVAGAVLAVAVTKGFTSFFEAVLLSSVGLRVIGDLQSRLFAHLTVMDVAFFHQNPTGTLVSRFTNDVNAMRQTVSNSMTSLGKDSLTLVFLISMTFQKDWVLALVAFFVFPAAVLPIVRLGKRMRKVTANTQEHMGLFNTLLGQCFSGIRVVKSYGMEDYEKTKMNRIIDTVFGLSFKAARVRAASSPIMESLGGVAIAVVIAYGGSRVIAGQTSPGAFFSFITALLMAYQPLKSLANLNTNIQEGLTAAARMYEVLDTTAGIVDRADARPLAMAGGRIQFDAVRFSYTGDQNALDGMSMDVPAGKTVALVGPSGAGKSTLLNLIPRFYDVDAGGVLIDGQDVRAVTMASLRANIALVSQEITLFDDTIRANIAYGRLEASEDDIVAAATGAAAHDFIMALPQGYDTVVGEQGLKLSGGQRQRLSIARAMLKNAPILLLDEATSALDTESERQVQGALEHLMRGRTTIVVAHRLSTVVNADLIHVIDKGRVAEWGSHAALLAQGGLYARLYALQFADEAPLSGPLSSPAPERATLP